MLFRQSVGTRGVYNSSRSGEELVYSSGHKRAALLNQLCIRFGKGYGVSTDICPICGLDGAEETPPPANKNASVITCERCGRYMMAGRMVKTWRRRRAEGERHSPEDEQLLPYLSAYTRQTYEHGGKTELDSNNWRDYSGQHSKTSEEQKIHKLLALIQKRTQVPGYSAPLNCDLDYPCIDAASLEECSQLLEDLKGRKLLKYIWQTRASYEVTILSTGRRYLEEISRQVLTIGRTDFRAVPEAARQDLTKAADRYTRGDLSGALTAACAAVDSACARVFEEKGLGDPAKVPSFQQKVMTSLRANGAFQRLESELISIGWNSEDAHRLAQNLEGSLNQAAYVMQTLRSKMSDAHGSKAVLQPVVFDSLKWTVIIVVQLG